MDNERIAPLKMAGVEGHITAVLTDGNLLLERNDGKGMRFDLDSITRIRHHHVAITPPLLTLFGVLALLASIRVFSGYVQIYSFILGSVSLLVWFMGRKPALCVDTKQGDRHILHGREYLLHRMYTILDRMSDGCTLNDALSGLEETPSLELALIGDIEEMRQEVGSVVAAQSEIGDVIKQDQSLEQALAELQQGKNATINTVEEIENNVESAYQRVWGRQEPNWYNERSTVESKSGIMDRSSKALATQRETTIATTNYDAAFQIPNFDNNNFSPNNIIRNENNPQIGRAQAAAKEASEASFDDGGMFGIFDQLDNFSSEELPPPTQTQIDSTPLPTTLPATINQNFRPSETHTSSYSMITAAAGPNLPEPTNVALRTDLNINPGLVASATVTKEVEEVPLPQTLTREFNKVNKTTPLSGYPALTRMHKQYAKESRLKVKPTYRRRRGLKIIREWVKPGISRIQEKRQEIGRKIIGVGDGYRDVYGDADGNNNDSYKEEKFQTNQIIRLRADQDSQSDIQSRLELLTKNGGGAIAEDLANRTLRGISNGFESSPTLLSNKVSKKLETPNNFSGMVSSTEPLPRFAGMKRLG
ncbi:MAG: hypothetical protein CMO20_01515 [Thermoplasmata archaeon]|nr:hypothetical protein [Thermoplasmata archaeon]